MGMKATIYTQDGCPHCDRAKEILVREGVPFEEDNVSGWQPGARDLFKRIFRTVPQVFLTYTNTGKQVCVGGADDLETYFE